MNDDVRRTTLRNHFGIRRVRAKIILNYKSLSGDQIYHELNVIYKSSNKQYIGSFNAFIYTSQYEMGNNNYNPTPISVPDKRLRV
jgi:hypothetical protein